MSDDTASDVHRDSKKPPRPANNHGVDAPDRFSKGETMGLDLALGAVVLLAAIRGWLRGFVSQAVRLSSFVGCFYLADPVRDQLRPYVLPRLPKVDPALMDRILWWTSAVASYVVVVGLASLAIKMMRRPDPSGLPEARRDDQFAGFLLGAAKGALVAAFLTAGLQN
jgi:uncharacterized membrane protein required for colicin V production